MKALGYICSYQTNAFDREKELGIQRAQILEYCANNKIQLLKIFQEPEDARADFKPELLKMLNYLTSNSVDRVIIFKYSVLSENRIMKDWLKNELKKASTELHSLLEDQQNPIDELIQGNRESKESKTDYLRNRIEIVPSLPEVVNKVMMLVQDPRSSADKIARIISYDPGLASRVLKMVNSAYYGFAKQISSIQHAIAILGFTTIRGLLLSVSIYRIFTPKNSEEKSFNYNKFWRHSLLTAIAGKVIEKKLFNQEHEEIFSMGLLHDLGKIILEQYDHENYIKAFNATTNHFNSKEVLENEEKFCSITHPEVAFVLAEHWNLPPSISNVLLKHHYPLIDEEPDIAALTINLANSFSNLIVEGLKFNINFFDPEVLIYLNITDETLSSLFDEIYEEMEQMGDLESFFK